MQKSGKLVLLLSLISIVFLAGCTSAPVATSTAGVTVVSFAPEGGITEVESRTGTTANEIFVQMQVRNTGAQPAQNVQAELIGLPAGGNEWLGDAVDKKLSAAKPTLFAADPEHGLPEGQTEIFEWKLTPPIKDVRQTYDFSGRLYYDYSTKTTATLKIIHTDYYRSLPSAEQTSLQKGIVSSTTSDGPLGVSVNAPQVIISGPVQIPVQFEITNTGGGGTISNTGANVKPTTSTLNRVKVTVTTSAGTLDCGTQPTEVRLINGASGRMSCTLTPYSFDTTADFTFNVNVQYRYFTDSKSQITVLKKFETATTTGSAPTGQAPTGTTTITQGTSQPVRSTPAVNNQPANPNSPPTITTQDAIFSLTTTVRATCRFNLTTSQTTYDSMTTPFNITDSTTHLATLRLPVGTHVFNAMCFDNTNKNTDAFIIKFIRS